MPPRDNTLMRFKVCRVCKTSFIAYRADTVSCSVKCNKKAQMLRGINRILDDKYSGRKYPNFFLYVPK